MELGTKSSVPKFGQIGECEDLRRGGRCSNRGDNGEGALRQGMSGEDTWMAWRRAGQSVLGVGRSGIPTLARESVRRPTRYT
jgi:hypothetical protein